MMTKEYATYKINYGISKILKKGRKYKNDSLEVTLPINERYSRNSHLMIRNKIKKAYPGWIIAGYAYAGIVNPKEKIENAQCELLKDFLTKKNVLDKFIWNLSNIAWEDFHSPFPIDIKGYIRHIKKEGRPIRQAIFCAFSWGDTPEKSEFWYDVSQEWRKLVQEKHYEN